MLSIRCNQRMKSRKFFFFLLFFPLRHKRFLKKLSFGGVEENIGGDRGQSTTKHLPEFTAYLKRPRRDGKRSSWKVFFIMWLLFWTPLCHVRRMPRFN